MMSPNFFGDDNTFLPNSPFPSDTDDIDMLITKASTFSDDATDVLAASDTDELLVATCIMAASELIKSEGIRKIDELRMRLVHQDGLDITEEVFKAARPSIQERINAHLEEIIATASSQQLAVAPRASCSSDLVTVDDMRNTIMQAVMAPMTAMSQQLSETLQRRDAHYMSRFEEQQEAMAALREEIGALSRGMNIASSEVTNKIAFASRSQASTAAAAAAASILSTKTAGPKSTFHAGTSDNFKPILCDAYLTGALYFTKEVDGVERMVIGNPQRLLDFDFTAVDMAKSYKSRLFHTNLHATLVVLKQRIIDHPEWYVWDERSVDDELSFDNVGPAHVIADTLVDQAMSATDQPHIKSLYPYVPIACLMDLIDDPTARYFINAYELRTRSLSLRGRIAYTKISFQETARIIIHDTKLATDCMYNIPGFPDALRAIRMKKDGTVMMTGKDNRTRMMRGVMSMQAIAGLLRQFLFVDEEPIYDIRFRTVRVFDCLPGGYHPCFAYCMNTRHNRPRLITPSSVRLEKAVTTNGVEVVAANDDDDDDSLFDVLDTNDTETVLEVMEQSFTRPAPTLMVEAPHSVTDVCLLSESVLGTRTASRALRSNRSSKSRRC